MKKLILIAVLALCASAVSAQTVIERDILVAEKKMPKKRGFRGYETNRFWDNFEVGLAGGAQFLGIHGTFGKKDAGGEKMERFNWQADVNITKWIVPVVGIRFQMMGGEYQNKTTDNQQFVVNPMMFPHFDVMLNMSNWIGGERDDRAYYAVLFGGMGYHVSGFSKKFEDKWGEHTRAGWATTAGLLNKFRVARGLDIELELKGWWMRSNDLPTIIAANDHTSTGWSATLGLAYRFNRRGWKQASPYGIEDIMAYQAVVAERDRELAACAAKNKKLAHELAEAKKHPAPQQGILLGEETILFFHIGSAALSADDKTRLDIVATEIMRAPKGKVFRIEGHSDPQTGTEAVNTELAYERAKHVYEYLLSKGVPANRMTYRGLGDHNANRPTPAANRNVTVK